MHDGVYHIAFLNWWGNTTADLLGVYHHIRPVREYIINLEALFLHLSSLGWSWIDWLSQTYIENSFFMFKHAATNGHDLVWLLALVDRAWMVIEV